METLFATMNDQLTTEVDSLFVDSVQTGPYEDRVDALIERRMTIFGTLAPYVRSSTLQRWRSAFLQTEHERSTRVMRRDLRRWLPEVESAPADVADALEMILSFDAWNRLRVDQRLGLRRTASVLRRSVLDLMRTHVSAS
jgi:hypothetical protein